MVEHELNIYKRFTARTHVRPSMACLLHQGANGTWVRDFTGPRTYFCPSWDQRIRVQVRGTHDHVLLGTYNGFVSGPRDLMGQLNGRALVHVKTVWIPFYKSFDAQGFHLLRCSICNPKQNFVCPKFLFQYLSLDNRLKVSPEVPRIF